MRVNSLKAAQYVDGRLRRAACILAPFIFEFIRIVSMQAARQDSRSRWQAPIGEASSGVVANLGMLW